MAKAINWPGQFREEVIEESVDELRSAFRLGRLYYDNHYWVNGEEIDVRVNHKVIRNAVIEGDLKCCPVKDLNETDLLAYKKGLRTIDAVMRFLAENYGQPVSPDTEVTVVYYRNMPLNPEIVEVEDDPHM